MSTQLSAIHPENGLEKSQGMRQMRQETQQQEHEDDYVYIYIECIKNIYNL